MQVSPGGRTGGAQIGEERVSREPGVRDLPLCWAGICCLSRSGSDDLLTRLDADAREQVLTSLRSAASTASGWLSTAAELLSHTCGSMRLRQEVCADQREHCVGCELHLCDVATDLGQ
jgi:hypothetical protein